MSTGRKRRVIEGNTVRKLQVREERHYRRQEESHAYRVERDQKIQYTTVIYMLFLTIAAAMVLWSCVTYLQLQAETTSRVKNIAALETELEDLKKEIDIPETILDWLVEAHPETSAEEWEEKFLAAVDQMSEWAFHDACTGANPVYPMIGELKQIYLRAFYGNEKFIEKYGDVLSVEVSNPSSTHAAYPLGDTAVLGSEKTGGFN